MISRKGAKAQRRHQMPPEVSNSRLVLTQLSKISSMGVPAASKRVGKGFAAKDNVGFRHTGRISVLSPPASSEADLGLAELAQAGTEFKIQEESKR